MSTATAIHDLPKLAWIAIMVAAFILFWPIGLAILAYLIGSGKIMCGSKMRRWGADWNRRSSSGNWAFDQYREDTLRRMEEEQREFRDFVERLRRAKDQAEFDQFMAERNARPQQSA